MSKVQKKKIYTSPADSRLASAEFSCRRGDGRGDGRNGKKLSNRARGGGGGGGGQRGECSGRGRGRFFWLSQLNACIHSNIPSP